MKDSVRRAVLKKIRPSGKEAEKVGSFAEKIVAAAEKVSGLPAVVCGSLGKGTWLSGNHDIDVFIMFPKETSREELEKKGLEAGARVCREMKGKAVVRYAEHPYTQCMSGGFKVDVVPCYRIHRGEKVISAVDRSPLHMEFVNENLKEEMKDDVLLLKQFCKAAGIYGSDAKTLGFSGYVCELLVLKYGSFMGVMKAAAGWHLPYTVDLLPGKPPHHKEVFVVVDPTDIGRNAAAVVSAASVMKFISRARRFLEKPSPACFRENAPEPLSKSQISLLKNRGTHFICIAMKRPDVVEDIVYQQSRRAVSRLHSLLKGGEFMPIRSCEFVGRKLMFLFELENPVLPGAKKMVGPPLFARKHVDEFVGKYRNAEFGIYVEGINVIADRKRDYTTPSAMLRSMMSMKKAELSAAGIPSTLVEPFASARIFEGPAFYSLLKDREFSDFMRRLYFEKIID